MRLYLSSYGLGNKPEELAALAGSGSECRAVIISNATDNFPDEERSERIARHRQNLTDLGFTVELLDLRNYFGKKESLKNLLSQKDLVWVRGGNTFILRRAMKQSGFDDVVRELLNQDSLVYGGYSAGAIVMTPTLHGIELADEPRDIPTGYEQEVVWDGFGLVGFSIAPHYRSNHPESAMMEDVVKYFEDHKMPYKAMHDGEVIIKAGDSISFIK